MTASPNLELVRSFGAAWERRDFSGMAELVHPELEFVNADGPEPGTTIGLKHVQRGWREYLSTWEDYRLVVDEIRELDAERVLGLFHLSGHGKTSGVDLEQLHSQGAVLFQVVAGKITRMVRYWDRERAFADLGLAPEADSPRS